MEQGKPLLVVENLKIEFHTEEGVITAVDDVSFDLEPGETLGLVGESGCGKSVTALSIMGLLPLAGRASGGRILFQGENLLQKSEKAMRAIRGREISMIFQEPMTSLNPVYTVGDQLAEAIVIQQKVNRKEAYSRAVEALKMVGIPLPEQRVKEYPHQLSGGMRQRVMIAMALFSKPKILIADEPSTALDVTIQAQIIQLMLELKEELGTAIILITHDLGVIAEMAQRVAVMYAGQVVEQASARDIFENSKHPYTEGLLKSIPSVEQDQEHLHVIKGTVPHPLNMPAGCYFHPRCPYAWDLCRETPPVLEPARPKHLVRCWKISKELAQK